MNPDWFSGIATLVAALVAMGALVVAIRANRRADAANAHAAEANAQAAEALALQHQVDARAREFRDVTWAMGWSPWTPADCPPQLQLRNGGTTHARAVTVLLSTPTHQELLTAGDIDAGDVVLMDVHDGKLGPGGNHIELVRDAIYRVHWTSPLGFAEESEGGPGRRRPAPARR